MRLRRKLLGQGSVGESSEWDVLWEGTSPLPSTFTLSGLATTIQLDDGTYALYPTSKTPISRVLLPYCGAGNIEVDFTFLALTGGTSWDFGVELRTAANHRFLFYKRETEIYVNGSTALFTPELNRKYTVKILYVNDGEAHAYLDGEYLKVITRQTNTEVAYSGVWFTNPSVRITAIRFQQVPVVQELL